MTIWSKITVEKALRYLFLLLSIGAAIMLLLNLSVYLGIGADGAIIRGWVHYGSQPPEPLILPIENGEIKIHNIGHTQFALVHFEHLSTMLRGLPLACLICLVLSDFTIVLVFYQLMHIFRSIDKGEVFKTNNLARVRLIAFAVLAFSMFSYLTSSLLSTYIQRSGDSFRGAYPAISSERLVMGALVALIIFALLKAFKLGTQLQQEQDLTV